MCIRRLRFIKKPAGSVFLFCLLALSLPSDSSAQVPFYRGKTITILNGNEPGGTADRRSKAMVPFLRKYIRGACSTICFTHRAAPNLEEPLELNSFILSAF